MVRKESACKRNCCGFNSGEWLYLIYFQASGWQSALLSSITHRQCNYMVFILSLNWNWIHISVAKTIQLRQISAIHQIVLIKWYPLQLSYTGQLTIYERTKISNFAYKSLEVFQTRLYYFELATVKVYKCIWNLLCGGRFVTRWICSYIRFFLYGE